MSNSLAIATTTAALQLLLQSPAQADLPGAVVTTERPDGSPSGVSGPRIGIFLYQVRPNAALRNADLPSRDPGGRLVRRTQAALDLHYLLSFSGDESRLEPQRLLGTAVRTLHERPVLTVATIRAVVDAARATPPVHEYLADADLDGQAELVRFVPLPLDLEELSNLWSMFASTSYLLSVAYQASMVLIEGEGLPAPEVPVRETTLVVTPHRPGGRPT